MLLAYAARLISLPMLYQQLGGPDLIRNTMTIQKRQKRQIKSLYETAPHRCDGSAALNKYPES